MIEFTALVPEYPKTHIEGHATVIDLGEKLAMKIASDKTFGSAMLKTIQYSRNNINGHGFRPVRHVQFFAVNRAPAASDVELLSDSDEDDSTGEIPMLYSVRTCAGVKTCEFFGMIPHTEVNPDGLEWPKELAKQERSATYAGGARALTVFEEHKDEKCPRQNLGGRGTCGGKTVIRSRNPIEGKTGCFGRLFIGCENYKPKDSGRHYIQSLDTFDPLEILQVWGRDRCYIHADILESLGVTWDQIEGM